jgi:transcriptional regulator with XRE-family HTH domain
MQIDHPAPAIIEKQKAIQERYEKLLKEKSFVSDYHLGKCLEKEYGIRIDKGTLNKILNGKNLNPTPETLVKIAPAFQMTPGELLDRVYYGVIQEAEISKKQDSPPSQTIKIGKFEIRLNGDITNLSIEILLRIQLDIRQLGGKNQVISDVREGSVIIEFEGDLEGFEKIQALVKSGELKELAGFEILDIELVNEMSFLVNLRDWLQGTFENGWMLIEQLLTPQQLAPSVFSSEQQTKIERAKQYQLGDYQVNLVVEVTQKNEEEVAIALKVYPIGTETYLPANLRLTISADGEELPTVTSREQTRLMQKLIDADFGDKFTLTLALDDNIVTEEFEM